MKFQYHYRSSDNKSHSGVICAVSKEAAYKVLRADGIKPTRVEEAPGFFNKLLGKGKRWCAIVLLFLAVVLSVIWGSRRKPVAPDWEVRSQIYGDPVVLKEIAADDWGATFQDAGDRWLACHAIPGRSCKTPMSADERKVVASRLQEGRLNRLSVKQGELVELAKMKRMINGLKDELNRYIAAGGTVEKYMMRADIRQKAEASIVLEAQMSARKNRDAVTIRAKNSKLRAMGLPMVEVSDEEP